MLEGKETSNDQTDQIRGLIRDRVCRGPNKGGMGPWKKESSRSPSPQRKRFKDDKEVCNTNKNARVGILIRREWKKRDKLHPKKQVNIERRR
jgi:hypothetical protein